MSCGRRAAAGDPGLPALVAEEPVEAVGLQGEEVRDLKGFADLAEGDAAGGRASGGHVRGRCARQPRRVLPRAFDAVSAHADRLRRRDGHVEKLTWAPGLTRRTRRRRAAQRASIPTGHVEVKRPSATTGVATSAWPAVYRASVKTRAGPCDRPSEAARPRLKGLDTCDEPAGRRRPLTMVSSTRFWSSWGRWSRRGRRLLVDERRATMTAVGRGASPPRTAETLAFTTAAFVEATLAAITLTSVPLVLRA